jgi:hypothetical protein
MSTQKVPAIAHLRGVLLGSFLYLLIGVCLPGASLLTSAVVVGGGRGEVVQFLLLLTLSGAGALLLLNTVIVLIPVTFWLRRRIARMGEAEVVSKFTTPALVIDLAAAIAAVVLIPGRDKESLVGLLVLFVLTALGGVALYARSVYTFAMPPADPSTSPSESPARHRPRRTPMPLLRFTITIGIATPLFLAMWGKTAWLGYLAVALIILAVGHLADRLGNIGRPPTDSWVAEATPTRDSPACSICGTRLSKREERKGLCRRCQEKAV